jgi:hypothetical protein
LEGSLMDIFQLCAVEAPPASRPLSLFDRMQRLARKNHVNGRFAKRLGAYAVPPLIEAAAREKPKCERVAKGNRTRAVKRAAERQWWLIAHLSAWEAAGVVTKRRLGVG